MNCELNVLSKPDGSVILSQADAVVVASVYGPYEMKHTKIEDDMPFQVTFKPKAGPTNNLCKTYEDMIRGACESVIFRKSYNRHETTLLVQELQSGGSVLPCAINASCLALINSGIDMQHMIAAASCVIDKDGHFYVHPDRQQTKNACKLVTASFESVNQNIITLTTEGPFTEIEFEQAVKICREAAIKVFDYYKDLVKQYANAIL
ncbi:exosome complex component Rrp46 [Rhodnius prolixus]|uniref:RNase_PH domain-containing protein n=3 Tax=Rhodnius TaxID=13248 RepID=T1HMF7_RHOPR